MRATVDRKVNEYTIKVMSRFFLLTGGLAFLAFGFSMVGLLYSNEDLVGMEPVRALAKGEWQKFEFLDYEDFPRFACEFTVTLCRSTPNDAPHCSGLLL